jgi:hypothetical protein
MEVGRLKNGPEVVLWKNGNRFHNFDDIRIRIHIKVKEVSWSRISVFLIPDPVPHQNEKRDVDQHHSLSDPQH